MISVLQFKTEYPAGKKPVDMVLIAPKGEGHLKTQTWHRVSKLVPPKDVDDTTRESLSYQDMAAKWSIIGPAYEAYKAGNEIPESGTPLAVWNYVTPEMAGALKAMGIKTVEDVRDMGDGAVSRLPFPNARKLPELARKFLDGSDAAQKDAENAELKERLAALEELLAERVEKPKRGRPPKAESEAA